MRLTSCRRGGVTGVDFSTTWRLQVAAIPRTGGGTGAALALVYRYQAAMPLLFQPNGAVLATSEFAQVVLAAADVDLATQPAELKPVADVALVSGARDDDVARMVEALNLFRNGNRVREETVEAVVRDCTAVLDGYWAIRRWIATGASERLELSVVDAQILGIP